MAYVIAEPCVDVHDRGCVDECPVDCIYDGARKGYIQPDVCVDCGACEPVCPVSAIFHEEELPPEWAVYREVERGFFDLPEVRRSLRSSAADTGGLRIDHPNIDRLTVPG